MGVHLIIYKEREIRRRDIKNHPRERFCCITAVSRFKVAKFEYTDSNVRKRPFETGPTNGLVPRSINVIYTCPPTPEQTFTGAKIRIIFEITNIFQKKSHFKRKKVITALRRVPERRSVRLPEGCCGRYAPYRR